MLWELLVATKQVEASYIASTPIVVSRLREKAEARGGSQHISHTQAGSGGRRVLSIVRGWKQKHLRKSGWIPTWDSTCLTITASFADKGLVYLLLCVPTKRLQRHHRLAFQQRTRRWEKSSEFDPLLRAIECCVQAGSQPGTPRQSAQDMERLVCYSHGDPQSSHCKWSA